MKRVCVFVLLAALVMGSSSISPIQAQDSYTVDTLNTFDYDIGPWGLAVFPPKEDAEGNVIDPGWTAGLGVSHGAAPDGEPALQLDVDFPGGETTYAGTITALSDPGDDWSEYTRLAMDVYVPEELAKEHIALFITTGEDAFWAQSQSIPFGGATGWVSISAAFPYMHLVEADVPKPDLAFVRQFGARIESRSVFKGSLFIDNVKLNDRAIVPLCTEGQSVVIAPSGPNKVHIRRGPGQEYERIGALLEGYSAVAYARTEAGDWLRISTENELWVSADVVTVQQGDVDALPLTLSGRDAPGTTWLYPFDTTIAPWELALPEEWNSGIEVKHGTTPDNQSVLLLEVSYSGEGGGTIHRDAGAMIPLLDEQTDLSQCTWLAVDLYVPGGGLTRGGVKLYLKHSLGWTWVQSDFFELSGSTGWIPILVPLQEMEQPESKEGEPPVPQVPLDLTQVWEMGVSVGTRYAFDGTIAIDNVRLIQ